MNESEPRQMYISAEDALNVHTNKIRQDKRENDDPKTEELRNAQNLKSAILRIFRDGKVIGGATSQPSEIVDFITRLRRKDRLTLELLFDCDQKQSFGTLLRFRRALVKDEAIMRGKINRKVQEVVSELSLETFDDYEISKLVDLLYSYIETISNVDQIRKDGSMEEIEIATADAREKLGLKRHFWMPSE